MLPAEACSPAALQRSMLWGEHRARPPPTPPPASDTPPRPPQVRGAGHVGGPPLLPGHVRSAGRGGGLVGGRVRERCWAGPRSARRPAPARPNAPAPPPALGAPARRTEQGTRLTSTFAPYTQYEAAVPMEVAGDCLLEVSWRWAAGCRGASWGGQGPGTARPGACEDPSPFLTCPPCSAGREGDLWQPQPGGRFPQSCAGAWAGQPRCHCCSPC